MAVTWDVMVSIVLIVLLLVVFFILRRQQQRLQLELREQGLQYEQLHERMCLFLDGAQGLGDRLNALESNALKPSTSQSSSTVGGEIPVRQAIELARKGATVDELVDICGLSKGEAELMTTIHKVQPH